jgi:hypothetical protein
VKKIKSHQKYSDALKREVGRRYLNGEFSYGVAADTYGLKDKTVAKEFVKWYKQKLMEEEQLLSKAGSEHEATNVASCNGVEAKVSLNVDVSDPVIKAYIQDLEKQLSRERLKVQGLETMLDVAKVEVGIDIRKKYGPKQ